MIVKEDKVARSNEQSNPGQLGFGNSLWFCLSPGYEPRILSGPILPRWAILPWTPVLPPTSSFSILPVPMLTCAWSLGRWPHTDTIFFLMGTHVCSMRSVLMMSVLRKRRPRQKGSLSYLSIGTRSPGWPDSRLTAPMPTCVSKCGVYSAFYCKVSGNIPSQKEQLWRKCVWRPELSNWAQ